MAMQSNEVGNTLIAALSTLNGSRLVGVIAGQGTGSVVALHFGELTPRKKPLANLHLDRGLRTSEGSQILFIECSWRLDKNDGVLCGSQDDNAEGALMLTGLASLRDDVVARVEVEKPGYDLTVGFASGQTLRFFCDNTDTVAATDNYSLFLRGEPTYVVGPRSVPRVEGSTSR